MDAPDSSGTKPSQPPSISSTGKKRNPKKTQDLSPNTASSSTLLSHRKSESSQGLKTATTPACSGGMSREEKQNKIRSTIDKYLEAESEHITYSQLMSTDKYQLLLVNVKDVIGGKANFKYSSTEIINLQLAQLVLSKRLSISEESTVPMLMLSGLDEEQLMDYINVLDYYTKFSIEPPELHQYTEIQQFKHLAIKTRFIPAIVFLATLAIKPDSQPPISAADIVELFSLKDNTIITGLLIICMSLNSLPIYCAYNEPFPHEMNSKLNQAQWLLTSTMLAGEAQRMPELLGGFSENQQNTIPPLICSAMVSEQLDTEAGRRAKFKKESRRLADISGLSSRVVMVTMKDFLPRLIGEITLASGYYQAIIKLTLALHYRRPFLGGQPEIAVSASYFVELAEAGIFPLLFLDAARLYITMNDYESARRCLYKLLEVSIPESLQLMVNNQIELCDMGLEAQKRFVETLTEQADQKARKKTRKKTGGKSGKKSGKKIVAQKKETQKKHPIQQTPITALPALGSVSSSPSPDLKVQDPDLDGGGWQLVQTPLRRKRPDITLLSTNDDATGNDHPSLVEVNVEAENGWLPDDDKDIETFLRGIRQKRNQADFKGEYEYTMNQLRMNHKQPTFGRICEEMGAFYHRLHENGYALDCAGAIIPENSTATIESRKWLCQALSCYLKMAVPEEIKPIQLKELVLKAFKNKPELENNEDFCIRIRSICSNFGHLHGTLMSLYGKKMKFHEKLMRDFFSLKRLDPFYETYLRSKQP